MPHPLVRSRRSSRFFTLALLVSAAVVFSVSQPALAQGIVWIVDPSGGGDFATVQAALDSAVASNFEERPDSILVAPGYYDEDVYMPNPGSQPIVLHGMAGSSATTIRRLCGFNCPPRQPETEQSAGAPVPPRAALTPLSYGLIVSGVTIVDSLWIGGASPNEVFVDCVFLGHVRLASFSHGRFFGCQFHGGAEFINVILAAEDCRFVASRVFVRVGDIATTFRRCTFEGPLDTAVVHWDEANTDPVRLIACTFKNVEVAIASVRWTASTGGVQADSCRFEDIGNTALTWDHEGGLFPALNMSPLVVRDSYFLRCQRVADWGGHHPAVVILERDTLELCGPSSIRATVHAGGYPVLGHQDPRISDLVAIAQQGRLFEFKLHSTARAGDEVQPTHTKLWLTRLRVHGGGDTLGVVRTADEEQFKSEVEVTDSWFENSNQSGLWISASTVTVTGSTFAQAGGHALEIAARVDSTEAYVHHNTIFGSGGDGLRFSGDDSAPLIADVHHNLLVQNAGDGLHVGTPFAGSIAFNDAWLNYGVPYFGGGSLDSNLTVDPVFCDVANGDLTVSTVSPCGPAGPYGQIGALGVGCTRLADVGPRNERAGSTVCPNPARGWVELGPGVPAGGWSAEIFDVTGRRVWHREGNKGGDPVRWTGITDAGVAVRSGLYWVRFRSQVTVDRVVRLVWLE